MIAAHLHIGKLELTGVRVQEPISLSNALNALHTAP
jgi:hypothetical protein